MIYHDYARESGGFRVSIDHLLPQIHGWRELLLIMSSRWFQGKISKRKPWFSPSDMRVSWVSCNFSLDPIQKNIIPLRTCGSTRLPQPCTPASPGGVPAAESTGKGETHIDRDQLVACHENIVRKYCFRKKTIYIYIIIIIIIISVIIIIYIYSICICALPIYIYMMQPPRSPPKGYGYMGIKLWVCSPPCGWVGG
jgi:hypothetical protein